MTTPTQEAAEIVAGLLGGDYTADKVLVATISCPAIAFARYVTEETEVTDAMLEAGRGYAVADGYGMTKGIAKGIFQAMIAAKHGQGKAVDPLVTIAREMTLLDGVVRTNNQKSAIRSGRAGQTASEDFYDRLRVALSACGKMIADIPVEAPTIDEEAVKREAREKLAATNDGWEALIATTRELHLLRAKVGGQP